ncbi:hypothetical protein IMCC26256_11687 [Actinobacteria bacterium IMCC26256]|nr:hypothetical protein IMCC26256_11687 [Actinobacteria bacterium IMCC26256]
MLDREFHPDFGGLTGAAKHDQMEAMEFTSPIADGLYDVIIIWADEVGDGALSIDLVITTGDKKGELLTLRAYHLTQRDPIDLAGHPCSVRVLNGEPEILL